MNRKQFDVDLTYKTYNVERVVLNPLLLHPAPRRSLPHVGECKPPQSRRFGVVLARKGVLQFF